MLTQRESYIPIPVPISMSTREEVTQILLHFSESLLNYVVSDFDHSHEDQKDDIQERCEALLQYAILVAAYVPTSHWRSLLML